MSRAVNKYLSVVKTFQKIFGIDWLWLDSDSNTSRTKKENTDHLYNIKFHTPTGLFTAADLTSFDTVISCCILYDIGFDISTVGISVHH